MTENNRVNRIAVFVSKYDHCLKILLDAAECKGIQGEIAMVISNHESCRELVEGYGIPYFCFPVTMENKTEVEVKQHAILDHYNVDLVVLARYMQVLTASFVNRYRNKIINIHHGLLPSFKGAKPYHQAFEQGVKIIGATSHYVTEKLDEGAIIEQGAIHIGDAKTVAEFIELGKPIESEVLLRAVYFHLSNKINIFENRCVILGDYCLNELQQLNSPLCVSSGNTSEVFS